jgi:hypothetical protein
MKKHLAAMVFIVSIGGCSQPATEQSANASASNASAEASDVAPPNVTGKWVGTGESIVRGQALHHEVPPADKPLLDNVQFTISIDGQDAHRFWGTVSSAKGSEPLTGVIGWDGKTIHARSREGIVNGSLVDPDTIELIYSEAGPATVVAINRYTRQK